MRLRHLEIGDTGSALELIVGSFASDSVLHAALHVDAESYRPYVQAWLEPSIAQGLSWTIIDEPSRRMAACLLAMDYDIPDMDSYMPERLLPMKALFAKLDAAYAAVRGDDQRVALVDLAVVSPAFRQRGLYRQLREAVHQDAYDQGFTHVVGELSSAATQRVCIEQFGHRVVAEVPFESFEFEGQRPFASIISPSAIRMVEGQLPDPSPLDR